MDFQRFFAAEVEIKVTGEDVTAIRQGFRTVLADDVGGYTLGKTISGQLPYYYRKLESVLQDFQSRHNALELLVDLMAAAPTTTSFRNSHCGEIVASQVIERKLGMRRLYSKLTMTTSENTNAHKMDALFVDMATDPFRYVFVEAKASILPTVSTPYVQHRNGLLKRIVDSLAEYEAEVPRFELFRIRENLEADFEATNRDRILNDLRPPGPTLNFLGVSVTNASTQSTEDDDFILSSACPKAFDYHAVVVTDLAALATEAYGYWENVTTAAVGHV